jgi:acyl carrier protein
MNLFMEMRDAAIRKIVFEEFALVLKEKDESAQIPEEEDFALLEHGMDSLGMAILVVRLEERFGYDPFVLHPEPVYPRTMKEFLQFYIRYGEHAEGIPETIGQ